MLTSPWLAMLVATSLMSPFSVANVVLPPMESWVPVMVSVVPAPLPLLLKVPAPITVLVSILAPDITVICQYLIRLLNYRELMGFPFV